MFHFFYLSQFGEFILGELQRPQNLRLEPCDILAAPLMVYFCLLGGEFLLDIQAYN